MMITPYPRPIIKGTKKEEWLKCCSSQIPTDVSHDVMIMGKYRCFVGLTPGTHFIPNSTGHSLYLAVAPAQQTLLFALHLMWDMNHIASPAQSSMA
jgi:hypothetical protein